ncbi:hypothetical protein [Methylobacterium trifolii]|uniref:Uncharacterized protein n=1 Tax=Methylobacterium trifolii TaxID=1003092 RepID=A0ABQ4TV85_9HYPH|nr:hypothetical protein [Methylobacterium trifolii]GJE58839.1 hypothetical protein MPOCJGCO_0924 [Methylobacterium trifolii]
MSIRKTITAAITALTLGTAVAAPGHAQAMGFGGLAAAGIMGDIALGAARAEAGSRRGVIVEHRYVRKGNRLQYCGCVVRHVRFYP